MVNEPTDSLMYEPSDSLIYKPSDSLMHRPTDIMTRLPHRDCEKENTLRNRLIFIVTFEKYLPREPKASENVDHRKRGEVRAVVDSLGRKP